MGKKFLFCFPLKSSPWVMTFTNFAFAIVLIAGSSVLLTMEHTNEDKLYLILGIVMGFFNLIAGIILVYGVIKGKERLVFLYLLLELSNLMILSIFAIFNMFEYKSLILGELFLVCLSLWFGLYSMLGYYMEMAQYNSVKSGAIEITCNPHINPLGLPERAIESTAV